jgi:tetratricopeptide (TPR) repeat protein
VAQWRAPTSSRERGGGADSKMDWEVGERTTCAVLMASAGVLLALRLRPAVARKAWGVLLALGVLHALGLSFAPGNLVNINVAHHYLGAKYPIGYSRFYEVVDAAAGRPVVNLRDLDHPPAVLRDEPREQRDYYIDVLRRHGVEFEPRSSLERLSERARSSGALDSDAQRILRENLDAESVEPFVRDVLLVLDVHGAESNLAGTGRDITSDYGFNGSPFYALVRQLDPTLHSEFSPVTAAVNVVFQVLAVLALAWLAASALDLELEGRLATAALLFASWDFVGWALPGLVFAGFALPIGVALFAVRRGRAALAGAAIAWAGLIKLFPFALLAPFAIPALGLGAATQESRRWCRKLLASCAIASAALAAISMTSGRSWSEFLAKIAVQFEGGAYLQNSVSAGQALLSLGIDGPASRAMLSACAAALLLWTCWGGHEESLASGGPRRMLVTLAATGWLVQVWFNYYSALALLLLPRVANRGRWLAGGLALWSALSYLLPEFDEAPIWEHRWLLGLKLAPYVFAPAAFVALELRARPIAPRFRFALAAAALLVIAWIGFDAWRQSEVRRLDSQGGAALDAGNAAAASECYGRMIELAPCNALAHMNDGIALAMAARSREAGEAFHRAAELDPHSAPIRHNEGLWELSAGHLDAAAADIGAALEQSPCDDRFLYDLARVRMRQERLDDARALLVRALELAPENTRALEALRGLGPK